MSGPKQLEGNVRTTLVSMSRRAKVRLCRSTEIENGTHGSTCFSFFVFGIKAGKCQIFLARLTYDARSVMPDWLVGWFPLESARISSPACMHPSPKAFFFQWFVRSGQQQVWEFLCTRIFLYVENATSNFLCSLV